MEPTIQVLDSSQDHTLTWLLYQLLLKLNMEYGWLTNIFIYDITNFLANYRNRYFLDMGLLSFLFYYLWKGKIDLEQKSKFSFKIMFSSATLAFIIIQWDLDMFLWATIFTIVFCFIIADITILIARMMQFNISKIILVLLIIYMFF